MPPGTVNSRLAANTAARQLENVGRADRIAASAAAPAVEFGRRLAQWLRGDPRMGEVDRVVSVEWERMIREIRDRIEDGLRRSVWTGYQTALRVWLRSLGVEEWTLLMERMGVRWGDLPVVESVASVGGIPTWPIGRLPTAEEIEVFVSNATIPMPSGPALTAGLVVFPPPSEETVGRIVFKPTGKDLVAWEERIRRLSRLGAPKAIADRLIQGISRGESPAKLALRIRPLVQGVHSSAARIARTEAMRVAEDIQKEQWLSHDSVIGAQVLSVLGETTRPHHAARHGTVYFKAGKGSPSIEQMPILPDEPNCLCWSSPVFEELDMEQQPIGTIAGPTFDPGTMENVFEGWTERQRRTFVGSGRYQVVLDKLKGKRPTFSHFVDPTDGKLLAKAHLAGEDLARMEARAALNRDLLQRRATDVAKVRGGAVSKRGPFAGLSPERVDELVRGLERQADEVKLRATIVTPTPTAGELSAGEAEVERVASKVDEIAKAYGPQVDRAQAELMAAEVRLKQAEEAAKRAMGSADASGANVQALRAFEKVLTIQNAQRRLIAEASEKVHAAIKVADPMKAPTYVRISARTGEDLLGASGKLEKSWKAGLTKWRELWSERAVPGAEKLKLFLQAHPGRAAYVNDTNIALLRTKEATSTVAHEATHWLEERFPSLNRSAKAFLNARTAGEGLEKLDKLAPGVGYGPLEVARKDRFIDAYMGREYPGLAGATHTEILTMGMTMMIDDPITFWLKDPEYFRFMLRVMRGLS